MLSWKCPVCACALEKYDRTYKCQQGHSFDIAKQGYVNLLMSNKRSEKRHGDDKVMVLARQSFLEKGYYEPLRAQLCRSAEKYVRRGCAMLDAGCGEGWYTEKVSETLGCARTFGIDISRAALIAAAKRGGMELAVASINDLPLPDASLGLVMSVFAPIDAREFARVLAPGGVFLRAVPLEKHLMGLKRAVYDEPYENKPADPALEGFELIDRAEVRGKITLETNDDIRALFMMTPYYYKTGRDDQKKLENLKNLETETEFGVLTYRKL